MIEINLWMTTKLQRTKVSPNDNKQKETLSGHDCLSRVKKTEISTVVHAEEIFTSWLA